MDRCLTFFLYHKGSGVEIFGVIPAGDSPVGASFLVDDMDPKTVFLPTSADSDCGVSQQTYFSQNLPFGQHNITVKVIQLGNGNETADAIRPFKLNFFSISGESPQQRKKTNVGSIFGGTVGGVVFLALLALLVLLIRRRRGRIIPYMVSKESDAHSIQLCGSPGPPTTW